MANRCPTCKKFYPSDAASCPRCEPNTGELFGDPKYAVELIPRFRFDLEFPTGEKVSLWVEGEVEAKGLSAMLHEAADALTAAANAVAP
jgi:hypothetical protein